MLAAPPVEHVTGGVDDGERADDDVAELQARRAETALHAAEAAAAGILPTVAPAPAPTLPSATGPVDAASHAL